MHCHCCKTCPFCGLFLLVLKLVGGRGVRGLCSMTFGWGGFALEGRPGCRRGVKITRGRARGEALAKEEKRISLSEFSSLCASRPVLITLQRFVVLWRVVVCLCSSFVGERRQCCAFSSPLYCRSAGVGGGGFGGGRGAVCTVSTVDYKTALVLLRTGGPAVLHAGGGVWAMAVVGVRGMDNALKKRIVGERGRLRCGWAPRCFCSAGFAPVFFSLFVGTYVFYGR